MKAKKIILFGLTNLVAILAILVLVERIKLQKRYGERFRPHALILSDSVTIPAPANEVFRFYTLHYDDIYPETAEKHREFRLIKADSLSTGTEIICREGETEAMVTHHYVVRELIHSQYVYLASEPSRVEGGSREYHCNTYVHIDFRETKPESTELSFTIITQLPGPLHMWLARIAGGAEGRKEWEDHLQEELLGFREQYGLHKQNHPHS